jgi:eukaryotic-like serine/threonine-protein kinase
VSEPQDHDSFLRSGGALRGAIGRELSEELDLRVSWPGGTRIGQYAIVREIGRGGMGTVYLAERADGQFQQQVALKVLRPGLETGDVVRRFAQERQILAALHHPAIAQLYDGGLTENGHPYFVMEPVDGAPIDVWCDRRGSTIEERLRLFVKVGEAVQHAHGKLVVHRDLKPGNILVTLEGEVKLLDFGIAKLMEPGLGVEALPSTRTTTRVLTPEYASPEQVRGEEVTTASDIYQLGLLLYELLTGLRAHRVEERTLGALERAICHTLPAPPSAALATVAQDVPLRTEPWTPESAGRMRSTTRDRLRKRLAGDLDTIVLMALRKEPERRYATAEQMVEDVRRHLAGLPVRARKDTLGYRAGKFARRHRSALAAATAVLLLVAGLVAFYTARLTKERDRARLAAAKAERMSELLTGLFTGADPYKTRDKEALSVRGLLDAGAFRVQNELQSQPELKAEMLTVLGRTYQRLGVHDKAQPLLEEALALGRSTLGPEHASVAQTLNDLGVLHREKGDAKAAEPLLAQSLALRRQLLGAEHPDVAVTLVELGRVYSSLSSPERAEPLFREALALRRKVLGEEHRETSTSLSDLALLMWERGDLEGAEPLFRQSLAISRKVLAADHPNVASGLNNLALVVQERGDLQGAESMFREALAIRRQTQGPGHATVAGTLNNLGHALRQQGKYEEADRAQQEALAIARAALGEEHPSMAMYLVNLCRIHLARGRAADAEPLLRKALEMRRRTLREDDWRIAVTKSLLGASLTALRRYAEAEPLLKEAHGVLAPLRATPGHKGREARDAQSRLLALYQAWGRPEPAVAYVDGTTPAR